MNRLARRFSPMRFFALVKYLLPFFFLHNACILHCNTFHSFAAYFHVQMHWFAGMHANSHPRTLQPCDYILLLYSYSLFQCRVLHFRLSHRRRGRKKWENFSARKIYFRWIQNRFPRFPLSFTIISRVIRPHPSTVCLRSHDCVRCEVVVKKNPESFQPLRSTKHVKDP